MLDTAPVWQPQAQQVAFRQLLSAFSYPGRQVTIEGGVLQVLATLVDTSTSLADPEELLDADQRRRLGATDSVPEQAQFILMPGHRTASFIPSLGTLESPEQGATLVLLVEALDAGDELMLTGPGIATTQPLQVRGVHPDWWQQRRRWNAAFPIGVEMILVSDDRAVAIPRTTIVTGAD